MKVSITVKPNAKNEQIRLLDSGSLEIRVKARPSEGKANEAVMDALSRHYGVPKSRIRIIRGLGSRKKVVEIG